MSLAMTHAFGVASSPCRFSDLFALAEEYEDFQSKPPKSRRKAPASSPRSRKGVAPPTNNEEESGSSSGSVLKILILILIWIFYVGSSRKLKLLNLFLVLFLDEWMCSFRTQTIRLLKSVMFWIVLGFEVTLLNALQEEEDSKPKAPKRKRKGSSAVGSDSDWWIFCAIARKPTETASQPAVGPLEEAWEGLRDDVDFSAHVVS